MTKRKIILLSKILLLIFTWGLTEETSFARKTIPLNEGWSFSQVDDNNIRKEPIRFYEFGDEVANEQLGERQNVRLPHDWAIHNEFDKRYGTHTGALPWSGVGVYTKKLRIDRSDADKRFVLSFDGCMSFPEVSVNGKYAGGWDYGYLGFQVDITPFLNVDAENEIAVRCDTREHRSRWYPGAGIYRQAELIVCSRAAWIPQGGVVVRTLDVTPETTTKGSAEFQVAITPEITTSVDDAAIELRIVDPDGKVVFTDVKKTRLVPNGSKNERLNDFKRYPVFDDDFFCEWNVRLSDAVLWDVEAPKMYQAEITITSGDNVLDESTEKFGLRKAEWTVDDGFHLNGRRLQLKGVDLHHDQGVLGACAHPAAIKRQLSIMRDMGVNAIRTSHNPNASIFMDLCDEMGFVVWDELFDKWDGTAGLRETDDFYSFAERQARQLARRDRNRPSVCAWSIGNEIWIVESNQVGASNPDNAAKKRVAWLRDVFKKYDPTRRVGLGCFVEQSLGDYPPKIDVLEPLDIMGWNYGAKYRRARVSYPNVPVVYTESASAFSSRGYYDESFKRPERKDVYDYESMQVDSYDLISANGPRDIPDYDFERMLEDKYVAGEFVWTGFDYIGEPAPFEKEAKSSYFGIVDLCGTPKDRFYLYRSHWNEKDETIHILPHWNWEGREGQKVPVYVYTSGDSAELFLNGKSLGLKKKDSERTLEKPKDVEFDLADYYWIIDKFRLRWENVAYEPGTLEVVAYKDGKVIGRATRQTSGVQAALVAEPEKTYFEGDDDLIYVNVKAVDVEGTLCPKSDTKFNVRVEGAAELVGISNGNPVDYDSFADAAHRLFNGCATFVLRSTHGQEKVRVTIESNGFSDSIVELEKR